MHEDCNLQELATRLEAALPPKGGQPPEGVAAGLFNGWLSKVIALVSALKSGDWKAIAVAIRDILNILIDEEGGVLEFQTEAQQAGFDWEKIIGIVLELLPLILRRRAS